MKGDLAKATFPEGNKSLDDLLSKQRSNNEKGGIDYVSKANKKKNNKKKVKIAQGKDKAFVDSNATRGKTVP